MHEINESTFYGWRKKHKSIESLSVSHSLIADKASLTLNSGVNLRRCFPVRISVKINPFFNLTSGPIFGEYYNI